jgi:hypothetical protein
MEEILLIATTAPTISTTSILAKTYSQVTGFLLSVPKHNMYVSNHKNYI